MSVAVSGVCRYCGCTEDDACRLSTGEECSWLDRNRSACNAPECFARYETERKERKRAAKASRKPKRTPADIHQLICGRGRKRKGKAA